jgi:transcriptional regulator with XRE-family HTH domain
MARRMRPVTLEEIEARMPAAQRARVDKLTAEMRAEEMSLAQIRKARTITQSVLARRLGKSQALVSHVESAGDLFVSTLRKQVEALGGKLDIRANFPDMPTVSIAGFFGVADLEPGAAPHTKKRLFAAKAKGRKPPKSHKTSGVRHKKRASTARPHKIAAKA